MRSAPWRTVGAMPDLCRHTGDGEGVDPAVARNHGFRSSTDSTRCQAIAIPRLKGAHELFGRGQMTQGRPTTGTHAGGPPAAADPARDLVAPAELAGNAGLQVVDDQRQTPGITHLSTPGSVIACPPRLTHARPTRELVQPWPRRLLKSRAVPPLVDLRSRPPGMGIRAGGTARSDPSRRRSTLVCDGQRIVTRRST